MDFFDSLMNIQTDEESLIQAEEQGYCPKAHKITLEIISIMCLLVKFESETTLETPGLFPIFLNELHIKDEKDQEFTPYRLKTTFRRSGITRDEFLEEIQKSFKRLDAKMEMYKNRGVNEF